MTRILFVDDDLSLAEEMKFLLEETGFEVTTANDGEEAFRIAREKEFDIVITDILLIKSHGADVILHMRQFHPSVKILTISGGGWASAQFHLDSARLLGADSCLAKPFSIETLVKEINRLLAKPQNGPAE
ncbi:MAG: response regulator [Bacteroidales bacterium]